MVIPPARTGRDNNNKTEERITPQTKRLRREYVKPGARIFKKVTIKLIEPRIDEIPEICNAKIAQSTDRLGIPIRLESGG